MARFGPKGERLQEHPAITRARNIRQRDERAKRAGKDLEAAEGQLLAAAAELAAAELALEEHEYARLRARVRELRAARDEAARTRDAASRTHTEAAQAANLTEWDRRAAERAEQDARRHMAADRV